MEETFGIESTIGFSSVEINVWYALTNDIWKNVLRDHPAYTGYDIEDTTPGYGRDPITRDVCLRAQTLLNEAFKRHLLGITEVSVVACPDGDLEFEWYSPTPGRELAVVVDSDKTSLKYIVGPFDDGRYRDFGLVDDVEPIVRKFIEGEII